jgi:hypothetical protein
MVNHRTKQSLLAAVLVSSLFAVAASAGEPAVKTTINAQLLGITESVLQYCSKTDAANAVKLQARVEQLVQGASEEAVARIRKTREYRTAYDSATDFVSKVADQNASKVCTDALAESK